jgi:hypothetical protein
MHKNEKPGALAGATGLSQALSLPQDNPDPDLPQAGRALIEPNGAEVLGPILRQHWPLAPADLGCGVRA